MHVRRHSPPLLTGMIADDFYRNPLDQSASKDGRRLTTPAKRHSHAPGPAIPCSNPGGAASPANPRGRALVAGVRRALGHPGASGSSAHRGQHESCRSWTGVSALGRAGMVTGYGRPTVKVVSGCFLAGLAASLIACAGEGALPVREVPVLPLQTALLAHQAPLIDLDGQLHVGADVAAPSAALPVVGRPRRGRRFVWNDPRRGGRGGSHRLPAGGCCFVRHPG